MLNKHSSYENHEFKFREIKNKDYNLIKQWIMKSSIRDTILNSDYSKITRRKWYRNYKKDEKLLIYIVEEKQVYGMPIGTTAIRIIDDDVVEFMGFVIGETKAKNKGYGMKIIELTHKIIFNKINSKYSYLQVNCNDRHAVKTYISSGYKINSFIEKEDKDIYIMRAINKNKKMDL
ncbi:hypothetical protein SH1V18_42840 [Vallitalea longa]|uniref:N-acetyltransferase domain-containing protein n=1 Tax=Vallitalea longa TaxID=2936439 RepID=A0A9W6DID9_9FIRM|nr:hypothetical protein SH1V18_42840 [Vallitalea longa]